MSNEIKKDVIKFFYDHPKLSDIELHKWCEDNKYEVSEVEEISYQLAHKSARFALDGKSVKDKINISDVDSDELNMGIEVEKEHTSDIKTSTRIALDHLAEIKDYYTRLKKMEQEAKGSKT